MKVEELKDQLEGKTVEDQLMELADICSREKYYSQQVSELKIR